MAQALSAVTPVGTQGGGQGVGQGRQASDLLTHRMSMQSVEMTRPILRRAKTADVEVWWDTLASLASLTSLAFGDDDTYAWRSVDLSSIVGFYLSISKLKQIRLAPSLRSKVGRKFLTKPPCLGHLCACCQSACTYQIHSCFILNGHLGFATLRDNRN